MKVRPVLAVIAGYVAWVIAFWTPMFVLSSLWPSLRETGRVFWEQGRYDIFDPSMLIAFQLIWPIANGAAGFVTRLVSKRQIEVYCLTALIFTYFVYNHLWALWGVMPDWYNIVVVIPVIPMIIIGSKIAGRRAPASPA